MTLEQVGESVYISFNQAVVRNVLYEKPRLPGIHVSDLIQPQCIRNIYYKKKAPLPMGGETLMNFYCGNIVHAHTDLSATPSYHEVPIMYDPVKDTILDTEKTLKEHPDPQDKFWFTVVVGEPDDILLTKNGNDYIIADKKTKLSKPETVLFKKQYDSLKQEHRSQLNMYRLLFQKKTGIDPKYGCILSLDFADKFKEPTPQPFELEDPVKVRQEMILRLEKVVKAIQGKTLPDRTIIRWMCDRYCPYKSWCFDGDGKNIGVT